MGTDPPDPEKQAEALKLQMQMIIEEQTSKINETLDFLKEENRKKN